MATTYGMFGPTEFELGLGVFGQNRGGGVGGGGGGVGNIGDLTRRTARSNIDASGDISQLAQMVNQINQRAQQAANAGRIPGGAGLEAISSGNINRALSGQVDPSVLQQLGQQAAERGIMTGSPGGPSSNAAYLRALGLTTMDLMNTGQDWLTRATARNPAAPIFDPSSMFLTPGQFGALEMDRSRLPRGGGGYSAGPRSFTTPEESFSVGGGGGPLPDLFNEDYRTLTYGRDVGSAAPFNPIYGPSLPPEMLYAGPQPAPDVPVGFEQYEDFMF